MNRYAAMFDRLRGRGEGAFGGFLMLGDPDLERSAGLLDALVAGGADMVEVAIPFSDPIADGPVIEAAGVRALKAGANPAACFDLLRDFRARHPPIPVGLLTYANLVLARGRADFYRRCAEAGLDSVLVADAPAAEARPFVDTARAEGIAPVLIAASNTPVATLERIAALSQGYVYCVARAGVTGADQEMDSDHRPLCSALARLGAAPSVLGFGISRPDHVRQALASGAAGVISGSAIVKIAAGGGAEAVRGFVASMKEATIGALV